MTLIPLSFLVETLDKLKYCLVELFQSSVMKENSKVQNEIIDNVLQQKFGNKTRKHSQEKTEEIN